MLTMLEQLSSESLCRMYGDPSCGTYVCGAVLRLLDKDEPEAVAKGIVMRLCFLSQTLPAKTIENWIHDDYKTHHKRAVNELSKLRILEQSHVENEPHLNLNTVYRQSLLLWLSCPKEPWTQSESAEDRDKTSIKYDIEQNLTVLWERLLYFLVGVNNGSVSDTGKKFLIRTELVLEKGKNGHSITAKGYEYLLKDQHEQAWIFIEELLKLNKQERFREEIVSFIFMLSYCVYGKSYALSAVSDLQRKLIIELSRLGLLYIPEQTQRFYPTQLSISLLSYRMDGAFSGSKRLMSERHISIIVETNFQVIAYVTSELYLAILRIFVDITSRLPNAVLGQITRAKSKEAFQRGITSQQIRHFLTVHAHALVRSKEHIIPQNVNAQILLWEQEQERLKSKDGLLLDLAREGMSKYSLVLACANELGACLWSDEKTYTIIVASEAETALEELLRIKGSNLL